MAARRNDAKQKLRLELKAIIKKNNEAFQGDFADEINGLLGLSRDEIDLITPDVTDLAVYGALIEVVKEASRKNTSQAELKARIRGLGTIAIEIAKKVEPLAKLLA